MKSPATLRRLGSALWIMGAVGIVGQMYLLKLYLVDGLEEARAWMHAPLIGGFVMVVIGAALFHAASRIERDR